MAPTHHQGKRGGAAGIGLLAVAASALVAALVVVVAILAMRGPVPAAVSANPTVTVTQVTTMAGPTVTVTTPAVIPSTIKATPTRTVPRAPHGTVNVDVAVGQGYGQSGSGPGGRCTNWSVLLQNNSDLEAHRVTFRAASGDFFNTQTYATRPAKRPAPTVLDLSLPAHSQQPVRFQYCTSSPSPGSSWEYDTNLAGSTASVLYANGYTGWADWSAE
jgi:hypothetical protein